MSSTAHLYRMTPADFAHWREGRVHRCASLLRKQGVEPSEAQSRAIADVDRALPQGISTSGEFLWTINVDDTSIGSAWVRLRTRAGVVEATIEEIESQLSEMAGLREQVFATLINECQKIGVSRVLVNVPDTDVDAYTRLGFAPVVFRVAKDFRKVPPMEAPELPDFRLEPMRPDQFDAFANVTAAGHAAEGAAAHPFNDRLGVLRRDMERLLPKGFHTPRNHFYVGYKGDEPIGTVWAELKDEPQGVTAIGRDVRIWSEEARHAGYGRAIMAAFGQVVRSLGADVILGNVFGNNRRAVGIYKRSGFEVISVQMALSL